MKLLSKALVSGLKLRWMQFSRHLLKKNRALIESNNQKVQIMWRSFSSNNPNYETETLQHFAKCKDFWVIIKRDLGWQIRHCSSSFFDEWTWVPCLLTGAVFPAFCGLCTTKYLRLPYRGTHSLFLSSCSHLLLTLPSTNCHSSTCTICPETLQN